MARAEDIEQEIVIRWAQLSSGKWPQLQLLHHIPNGGNRDTIEAAKLKRLGVLAGVPDLHLPVARAGYCSLYIEMKAKGGKLSKAQKDFLEAAAAERNCCAVCYSAEDAIDVINRYMRNRPIGNLMILSGGKEIGTVR